MKQLAPPLLKEYTAVSFVLLHLKECLDQKEIEEAEAQARACGMTLDEWLVHTLKSAIHSPLGVAPQARPNETKTEEE